MADRNAHRGDGSLDDLLLLYFEGEPSAAQVAALNAYLRADPLARKQFVATALMLQACSTLGHMRRQTAIEDELATLSVMGLVIEPDETEQAGSDETMAAMAALAPRSLPDDGLPFTPPKEKGAWWSLLSGFAWPPRKKGAWLAMAAAILIVSSLAVIIVRKSVSSNLPVATLTRMVDAAWSNTSPSIGSPLRAQTHYSLVSGYAEMTFVSGASVVVQAPAEFTLVSSGSMSLLHGQLAATVPPPAHGFTVTTPSATVTDLGTEFGVLVRDDGRTRMEVFKGTVSAASLVADQNAGGSPARAQLFSAGQAAEVSGGIVTPDARGSSPQNFVRSLETDVTSLDLVDLLAGGDGTTHRRGAGINQSTGMPPGPPIESMIRTAEADYHRVRGIPVVDGCFVPNGRNGPIAVDSSGDQFAFPATTGTTDRNIWAGGKIPGGTPDTRISSQLGEIDYASAGHSLIFVHANGAITFDCDAIRHLHPGLTIASLHFMGGNSSGARILNNKLISRASLFVIVDGVARFERRSFLSTETPFAVDVPLRSADRFLTLAVTDDGHGINSDWILFGDPTLETTLGK